MWQFGRICVLNLVTVVHQLIMSKHYPARRNKVLKRATHILLLSFFLWHDHADDKVVVTSSSHVTCVHCIRCELRKEVFWRREALPLLIEIACHLKAILFKVFLFWVNIRRASTDCECVCVLYILAKYNVPNDLRTQVIVLGCLRRKTRAIAL